MVAYINENKLHEIFKDMNLLYPRIKIFDLVGTKFFVVFTKSYYEYYFKQKQNGRGLPSPTGPLTIRIVSQAIVAVNREVEEELDRTTWRFTYNRYYHVIVP